MKISIALVNKKIVQENKILAFFKKYKHQIFITCFLFVLTLLFVINSERYLNVIIEGVLLYGTKVLPSLLPFFFVTKILSNFGFIYSVCNQFSSLTKLLFNTKAISSYIFFMSIISGYPVGAKLTSEFYEKKLINSNDAQKILSFCSTSGPLFIIGTVGVGFFCNEKFGFLLLLTHIISSILNGILYRNYKKKNNTFNKETLKDYNNLDKSLSLQDCMISSINSVLVVGGYIVIFYVLINILLDYNLLLPLIKFLELLGLNRVEATGLSAGLIEITTGLNILSKSKNLKLCFLLASFLISFSGISILMQSNSFLEKLQLNKKLFVLQKITQGLISVLVGILIVNIFI